MTRKGGSRVNAKKYCLSLARKTLEAAALTGGLWTSGAAATLIRLNSLQGRCHILMTLNCWNIKGEAGREYIQLVANTKQNKVKFPSAHILVKTVQCVKLPYLKNVSKSCGHPLLFLPPPCISFKLFSRDCTVGKERSRGQEGLFGKKTSNRKFSAEGINMHASISHPSSIKSLNPLSCYQCSLFPTSLLHARETIHFFSW